MKKKFDKKICLVAAAVVVTVVAVIVGAVIAARGTMIDEDYFVSDGTKIVLNMGGDMSAIDDGEAVVEKIHFVYYYNGDKITGADIYYLYADADTAREVSDNLDLSMLGWVASKKTNGSYLVLKAAESQYEDLTPEAVRAMIENLQAAGVAL